MESNTYEKGATVHPHVGKVTKGITKKAHRNVPVAYNAQRVQRFSKALDALEVITKPKPKSICRKLLNSLLIC